MKTISILIGSFALASCSLPVTQATTKAKPESKLEPSLQAKTEAPIEPKIEPKTEAQAEQKTLPEGLVFVVTRATTSESRALLSARLLKMNASNLHWYNDTGVVSLMISLPFMDALKSDSDVALILSDKTYDSAPAKQSAPVIQTPPSPTVKAPVPAEKPVAPLKPPTPQPTPLADPGPVVPPAPTAAVVAPATPAPPAVQPVALNQFPPVAMNQMALNQTAMNQTPMPMIGGATSMPGPISGSMPGSTLGGLAMPGMGLMDSLAGGVVQKFFNRPASCKITITKAAAATFSADGGDGMFEVKASGSCAWQAQATVPWIQILSGSGVSGNGIVTYHVGKGEGLLRSGAISLVATAAGSAIKGNASQVVTQRP